MELKKMSEEEFRRLVYQRHVEHEFKGDPHKMEINFKDNKNHVGFVAIEMFEKDMQNYGGFCGLEIFKASDGSLKGMIHCLGVYKKARGMGLSHTLLEEVEKIAKEEYPDLKSILSTCNPISCKSHQKVGYQITYPGRLSPSGKLMQIRLEKVL